MFFNREKKQIEALITLYDRLEHRLEMMTNLLDIQELQIKALVKAYPYGANSDGSPRQKPGRKPLVQA
jgi:hypothetical protein